MLQVNIESTIKKIFDSRIKEKSYIITWEIIYKEKKLRYSLSGVISLDNTDIVRADKTEILIIDLVSSKRALFVYGKSVGSRGSEPAATSTPSRRPSVLESVNNG